MKKASLLLALVIAFLTACQDNAGKPADTTPDTASTPDQPSNPPPIVQCFENQTGPDTVRLRVTDSSGTISGSLDYRIDGKDANTGSFSGQWYGDTLIADYSFRSEGVTSVRQIAFLKKDSFLVEGFGPVIEDNKQMKFTSRDSLSFNEVNRLHVVPCR